MKGWSQGLVLVGLWLFATTGVYGRQAAGSEDVPAPAVSPSEGVESFLGDDSLAATEDSPASIALEGLVSIPEPSERAVRYYRTGNWVWAADQTWALLLPALLLFTGLSARMRDLARKIGRKWFFVISVYMILYTLVTTVVDLPWSYFKQFARQHAYGLSNQTLGKWFGDSLMGLLVTVIMAIVFVWVPYLLIKKSPQRWWLYMGLAMVPFLFFVFMIQPIWVAPLFNDFGPMQDKALEQKILGLAERSGIDGSRVFEVDKSVDTKALNAYVAGFMDTKRIVLWDTILEKLDEDEVLFIMAHEIGHFVLKHIFKGTFFISLLVMVAFYLVYRTSGGLIERFGNRFGFTELADVASFPLIIMLVNLSLLVLTPFPLAYIRHSEREADRFALELTHSNRAAAVAMSKAADTNLMVPRPGLLFKLWRSSHPPVGERIDFFNTYKPWETGEAQKYVHLFRAEP